MDIENRVTREDASGQNACKPSNKDQCLNEPAPSFVLVAAAVLRKRGDDEELDMVRKSASNFFNYTGNASSHRPCGTYIYHFDSLWLSR
jgi:hypothetical protein